ncbi:uncharacterized protein LOC141667497 [Apium graveolens]|uniref:uncharacterized protein LOC141667497 n=1 Tax=Apium graveolens TaxID=4045 RepID=UPI003D7A2D68
MSIDPESSNDNNLRAWAHKVDGSSTNERSGAGLILKSPDGFTIQTTISFGFSAINNQAEYESLIAGLNLVKTLRIQELNIYSDSQIVVQQTNDEYILKDPVLAKYQALVQSYLASIPRNQVLQISQEENSEADTLSKLVQNSSDLDCSVYFEELQKPSIESGEVMEIDNNLNWMTPFIKYLEKGKLPEDKGKAQRLKAKTSKFFVEKGLLYRRTFSSPIPKCIGLGEAEYCLMEVHERICGDHMSVKALAHKIIRRGYYLPTTQKDANEFVKKLGGSKGNVDDKPAGLHKIHGQHIDEIRSPKILVSNNGPQFVGSDFESYLQDRGIKHRKSSVAYPQGNGQIEVTNRILLCGIEKRLRESKNKWPEELPNVLWAYRTSPRISTCETPFKLAYGTEAMLPIEVGALSHRAINFDEVANEEGLRTNIELIDEVRDQAVARMERYKEKTKEHFSKKYRVKNFQVGDLVLRDTEASDPTNTGKLIPRWEGPYKIKEVLRPGTYKLMNMDESEIPNTWHGLRLRKFYQ